MREYGRWHLTDFQRFLIVGTVVISMFLGAVAWGWGRIDLALVALFLLLAVGLGVFMLGLRYSGRTMTPLMAEVLAVSPPPRRGVVGKCDMQLLIDLPSRGLTKMKLRRQVDVTKWPRVGMRLPVQVYGRGQVEIRWQAFGSRVAEAAPAYEPYVDDIGPVPGYNAPIYTDYRAGAFEQDYAAPEAPGPTVSGAVVDEEVPSRSAPAPPGSAYSDEPYDDAAFDAYVEEHYRDDPLDDPYFQEPYPYPPGTRPPRQRTGGSMADEADTTVHSGRDDGPVDMRIYFPDRTDTKIGMADPRAAPLEVDVEVDFDGEERARAADFEVPRSGPPLPRRGDRPPSAAYGPPPTPVPEPTPGPEPVHTSGGQAISIMLVVADIERSVTFYRDRLGFTVDDQADGGAVLSHGAAQIVLQRLSDMAPVDRRVVVLRLTVPDVEAAYSRLKDQGVHFAQQLGWVRVGRRDLRAAKLHDPDGHAIQIVQDWRRADGSARP